MGQLRIGTSGWNYKHWKGRFYPAEMPPRQWFDYYRQHFDTVEINNTFYRQPPPEVFAQWRAQAPADFLYAVKANRFLTHMLKLKQPEEPLARFYRGARELEEHLGPVLFQLPPNWKRNLERLRAFLAQLALDVLHVVEFRHRSWLSDDTYALLREYNVCLCIHDAMLEHPRVRTGSATYVRFHGARHSQGRYSLEEVATAADWLGVAADEADLYVYFNNDLHGHAIDNAEQLRQRLGAAQTPR